MNLIDIFQSNQFASGGLVLVLTSYLAYMAREIPSRVAIALRRLVLVEIEVSEPGQLYWWLGEHFDETGALRRVRNLSVTMTDRGSIGGDVDVVRKLRINYVPGFGFHVTRCHGHWVVVHRTRSEMIGAGSPFVREAYRLTALAWAAPAVKRFIADVRDEKDRAEGVGPDVYVAQYRGWNRMHRSNPRPMSTVILKAGVAEGVVARCREFLASRERYERHGVPWRLGILLHGAPGCGKSSFVHALATELGLDVGVLNLSDDEISDNNLLSIFANATGKLVVVEDVDSIYVERRKEEGGDKISFSGLLNAIDGVSAGSSRIMVMTTNHPDRLDAALKRPGRIDVSVAIDLPDDEQIARAWRRFHDDLHDHDECADFVFAMRGRSMADVQDALLTSFREGEAGVMIERREVA